MAINFKKIAQKQTTISDLMNGRTKVNKPLSGVVHISEFDIVTDKKGQPYAICAVSDKEFINGGMVLTRIFSAIVEECGGDLDRARKDFAESEGLDVKLTKEQTSTGRTVVKVEVI